MSDAQHAGTPDSHLSDVVDNPQPLSYEWAVMHFGHRLAQQLFDADRAKLPAHSSDRLDIAKLREVVGHQQLEAAFAYDRALQAEVRSEPVDIDEYEPVDLSDLSANVEAEQNG